MGYKLHKAGFEACFGWDPRPQTTDARVLVGTPGPKGAGIKTAKTHLKSRGWYIFRFIMCYALGAALFKRSRSIHLTHAKQGKVYNLCATGHALCLVEGSGACLCQREHHHDNATPVVLGAYTFSESIIMTTPHPWFFLGPKHSVAFNLLTNGFEPGLFGTPGTFPIRPRKCPIMNQHPLRAE